MRVTPMTLGEFETNCYLVQGPVEGACLLIDPADDGPAIARMAGSLGVQPEAVLLTHGHYDHILAIPDLQSRWPQLRVYCHRLDCPASLTEEEDGVVYPTVTAFSNLVHYDEGDVVEAAGLAVRVLHTPGHTPGSVTLAVEDALFTGDTLFQGDIGRTDFEGGDDAAMARSLGRLAALPGDYRVLPGHDAPSTLDAERRENPYLKQ